MILETILLTLVVTITAILYWEIRHRRVRQTRAQDYQKMLHPTAAFHVITFFRLHKGDKLIAATQRYLDQLPVSDNVQLIYAGQVAFTIASEQLSQHDWDGVLLLQYPTRSVYQQRCEEERVGARLLFADSYQHGMRRDRKAGLSMPRFLLGVRIRDILKGNWRIAPFQKAPEFDTYPQLQAWRVRVNRLRALHQINPYGLVMFNLVKRPKNSTVSSADPLTAKILSRMAAFWHGPLHIGRSVALERSASFNRVYIIYYPNGRYYADMLSSRFYFENGGYRPLNDGIRVSTIPLTALLQAH